MNNRSNSSSSNSNDSSADKLNLINTAGITVTIKLIIHFLIHVLKIPMQRFKII